MRHIFPKNARKLLCFTALAASLAGCSGTSDAQGTPSAAAGAVGLGGSSNTGARGGATTSGGSGASAGVGGSAAIAGASSTAGASSSTAGASGSANTGGTSSNAGSGNGGSSAGNGTGGRGGASNSAGAAGVPGSAGAAAAGAGNLPAVSVYIAGDSTVSEYKLDPQNPKSQAGWGQMLSPNYDAKVKVLDKAVGGRTARRFIQEGTLAAILQAIKPGDYLLVQFGTNDSNTTAKYTLDNVEYPYYAAADTDFKSYLQQYIDGAKGKQAIPVLVTPPPRNSAYCKGPRSLGNYGQAMIDLGKTANVAVVDLGLKTHAHLTAICPKPTTGAQETFFKSNADDTIDGTHFQENGARIMAGFVADGIGEAKLGLNAYRKP